MFKNIKFSQFDYVNTNVLVCNRKFDIIYANKQSVDILNELDALLPPGVCGDTIVGTNIDVFHKTPTHQRHLLGDLKNLPHKATISLGKEFLDLHIEAHYNFFGKHDGYVLCWNVSTKAHKLDQMVNKMPINVMMADPETFDIIYINETSVETLRTIEDALPVKADQLLGESIDIFHKNPGRIRDLLRDPANLPHKATIKVGKHYLLLDVEAIMTKAGAYLGPMLSWRIVTENFDVVSRFESITDNVSETFSKLQQAAQRLANNVEQTQSKTTSVANATADTDEKVQSAAAAAEELSASIKEISVQVTQAAQKSEEASSQAGRSMETINALAEASESIGGVIALINDITEQINLLALNATIESARAGEAGKGFAVVANEIKNLASQTASATGQIDGQIKNIQESIRATVQDMENISSHVMELSEANTIIASAVEEQTAVASDISQNIQDTAANSAAVTREISEVSTTADSTLQESEKLNGVSQELAAICDNLRELVTYAANQMGIKR